MAPASEDGPVTDCDPDAASDRGPQPALSEATHILRRLSSGEQAAARELYPLVQAELRRLAGRAMAGQRGDHTLQPTALVHEAWIKLVGQGKEFEGREHFLAVSARAMRSILVDHARARASEKRGGALERAPLTALHDTPAPEPEQVLAVDGALERLAEFDERLARVVELRWFGGLEVAEAAAVLRVSESTLARDWRAARAWLHRELAGPKGGGGG